MTTGELPPRFVLDLSLAEADLLVLLLDDWRDEGFTVNEERVKFADDLLDKLESARELRRV